MALLAALLLSVHLLIVPDNVTITQYSCDDWERMYQKEGVWRAEGEAHVTFQGYPPQTYRRVDLRQSSGGALWTVLELECYLEPDW